jgi:hypothetical protein
MFLARIGHSVGRNKQADSDECPHPASASAAKASTSLGLNMPHPSTAILSEVVSFPQCSLAGLDERSKF